MDPAFWKSRWQEGRIAFHEGRPNHFLERHVARLGDDSRVLVPLCGKAEDMAWLAARGHEVVGVEVVEPAVRAFFSEHQLTAEEAEHGAFTSLSAGPITLLAGDFFATSTELLGAVGAFYDRAAVVALPTPMRRRYVEHLRSLLAPGTPGIVITFEYPQDQMQGPPFSVPEPELRELYTGAHVELLDEGPAGLPRFKDTGTAAYERAFLVTL
jgi:thiopurine S-methyltransferase